MGRDYPRERNALLPSYSSKSTTNCCGDDDDDDGKAAATQAQGIAASPNSASTNSRLIREEDNGVFDTRKAAVLSGKAYQWSPWNLGEDWEKWMQEETTTSQPSTESQTSQTSVAEYRHTPPSAATAISQLRDPMTSSSTESGHEINNRYSKRQRRLEEEMLQNATRRRSLNSISRRHSDPEILFNNDWRVGLLKGQNKDPDEMSFCRYYFTFEYLTPSSPKLDNLKQGRYNRPFSAVALDTNMSVSRRNNLRLSLGNLPPIEEIDSCPETASVAST